LTPTTTPRYDFIIAANHCRKFYHSFSTILFFNFYYDFFRIPLKSQEWKWVQYLPQSEVRENPHSKQVQQPTSTLGTGRFYLLFMLCRNFRDFRLCAE
jgi:hypothetical protein